MTAKPVNNALDTGDIVVLGNNEGNKTFPAILTEKSDASCITAGFGKSLILRENFFQARVVSAEIEIIYPFADEIVFGGVMEYELPFACLGNSQKVVDETSLIGSRAIPRVL